MSIIDAITDIPDHVLSPEEGLINQLSDRIKELEVALQSALNVADAAKRDHQLDISYLSDELNEEAVERNWCSEYQEFIDRVNHRLTYKLEPPTRDYTISISMSLSGSFTVTANNEDAAREEAERVMSNTPSYFWVGEIQMSVDNEQIEDIEED